MSRFRLIAIRPLEGCDKKFLKVLKAGRVYRFHTDYEFEMGKDGEGKEIVSKITYQKTVPEDLYDIKREGGLDPLRMSVCAVVGKNGSGKSSIVELLYPAVYNLAVEMGIITDPPEESLPLELKSKLNVEFFFHVNGKLLLWQTGTNGDGKSTLFSTPFEETVSLLRVSNKKSKVEHLLAEEFVKFNFFYAIVQNFSHYALNSLEMGRWLPALFHKNDGYQTPLVINPWRHEGNIDINREHHLAKSRLLANILGKVHNNEFSLNEADLKEAEENSLRCLIGDKVAHTLHIEVDRDKFKVWDDGKKEWNKKWSEIKGHYTKAYSEKYWFQILNVIERDIPPKEKSNVDENLDLLDELTKEYLLKKLFSMARKYQPYKGFLVNDEKGQETIPDISGYLTKLGGDSSHITFKWRQALNFFRSSEFDKTKEKFKEDVRVLAKKINDKDYGPISLLQRMLPSFLKYDIQFSGTGEEFFNSLSSGEKQKVYGQSSITYHLKNLDSAFHRSKEHDKDYPLRFENVNVIFDEIELYFHPELQRTFLYDFRDYLKKARLKHIIAINCIFITHSPFILSDIPSQNVMYLEAKEVKGKYEADQMENSIRTFGANIHELLATSFFFDQGRFMGEFAYKTIMNIIAELGNNEAIERGSRLEKQLTEKIEIIGEPFFRQKLFEMLESRLPLNESELLQRKYRRKQRELKEIEKQLNKGGSDDKN